MTKFGTPIGAGPKSAIVSARVGVGRGAVGVAVRRLAHRLAVVVDLVRSSRRGRLVGGLLPSRGRRPLPSLAAGLTPPPVPPPGSRGAGAVVAGPVAAAAAAASRRPGLGRGRGRRRRSRTRSVERAGAVGVGEVGEPVAVVVGEVRALRQDLDLGEVAAVGRSISTPLSPTPISCRPRPALAVPATTRHREPPARS